MSLSQPNQILAALPNAEYQRLAPHLTASELSANQNLFKPKQKTFSAYFPTQGVVSLVTVMQNGSTTEIGLIGRDGLVGIFQTLGEDHINSRATVQIAGEALQIDADTLRAEFERGGMLQKLLLRYSLTLFNQVSQCSACNNHHTVEQRFARWLLMVQDRLDREECIPFTQQFLSRMLGTRRASITEVAQDVQRQGAIAYHRGRIEITDRPALEAIACECYQIVKAELTP
ncbi:MAG: Crp/Fnr family transcriptional regulator [Cyanophyceae cyanobacterium]